MFQRLCFAFIGFLFSFSLFAQHLTISTATTSGTYSISGNTLTVATAGEVILNPSVIINHLNTTGDLTIVMPQNGSNQRSLYLNAAINYTGSTARTLTFQIGNDIIATSGISVTSTNAPLNVVFRSATYLNPGPDNGRVKLDGVTINTNGGHLWIGGGANNATWNGLIVGNNYSTVWMDDIAAISIVGSTINTNGGAIGLKGLSWDTANNGGTSNYGINIENASISSSAGNISIDGLLKGRYSNGSATRIGSSTSTNLISSTSGTITIFGTGMDESTNGNSWRNAVVIYSNSTSLNNTISSVSGNITIEGNANFTASVNDKEGIALGGLGLKIVSQTGNIAIKGSNTLESSGQFCNSIRLTPNNESNAIRIGFDGSNTYSGNILIEGNSIYQRNNLSGSGSIAIQSTGSLTIQPSGNAFSYMRAGDSGTLTYDNDWNFGTTLSSFTLGKTSNSTNLSFANVLTVAGSLNLYAGELTLNSNLTSTATGNLFFKSISNSASSFELSTGVTLAKTAGTGTATFQAHGRIQNIGAITASGTGVLNVVIWSDFDGDNVGGGVSHTGTISTNGGHVWLGGSSTNGGSYTWNGLAVGDGPSVGASGANTNALNIYGNITTSGGDILAWAGAGVGSGIDGIANDGTGTAATGGDIVNVGSGDIILITDKFDGSTGSAMFFDQNGGTFTLVPNDGSFISDFNWNPNIQSVSGSNSFNFLGDFNFLGIINPAVLLNLTIGRYDGMLNGTTPVVLTNSSNVTMTTSTTVAGEFKIYGGAIALNTNIGTSNTSLGNVLLQGTTLSGTGNIALAAGRTASINVSVASTYDGIISGSGSALTKLGAGTLTLTKDHTYSGITNINAGDLQVGTGGSVSQSSSGTIASTSAVVVASGSKLILSPNENITFTAPISGAGGVEIKGASGSYYNTFLTATPSTIATNSTVLEVLTRITGGLQQGGAISTNNGEHAGAYHKSYNAANNTATLQLQQFEGTYTKCVFVRLSQSGTNVQISVNTSIYNGAAYRGGPGLPSQVGQDMSTGSSQMGFTSSANSAGYGISMVYMSGKVNFTGALSYTGNTTLSSVTTPIPPSPFIYSYTSKGTQEITDASSAFPAASTVVNNGLVIFNRTSELTIASNMSGTEDILQVGSPITLSGACTHSGNTTIDLNKSLIVGNGATAGSITGNIINYGSLTFNRSDNSSYPGVISGTGTLVKNGTGEHTLSGLQTFTGATTINAGKLIISRNVPTFSSSSISGAGELVIQPTSTSFTNAVSYPISGITVGAIGGLTLGKSGNLANITFANALSIAGPITAYGGTINVNVNLSSTLSGADILLQGSKVIQTTGTTVLATSGDITYTATNTPWTSAAEQSILVGTATGSTTTINAQGGNISLSGTFATTGVTNAIIPNSNPTGYYSDVTLFLRNATIRTNGAGTISMNGNAYDNASTEGDYIWGVVFTESNLIQTQSGNISITGTPGKIRPNGRGIVADGSTLHVLSASGTINITDAMPSGHTLTNYTGAYFKPASVNAIRFGAGGTEVTSSTSNIIFDVNYITFDVNPTVLTSTGTLSIRPVANSFSTSYAPTNLTIPNTLTGLTIGKSGNTADLTLSTATTINGPITLYGGTLNLNANLTTTSATSTASNISLNGSTIIGTPTLTLATGSTLTMNLSSNTNFAGPIVGTSLGFVKNGAGTLSLTGATALSFVDFTISGGTYRLNGNQQLSLSNALTNNGTFRMKDGATFIQGTSVTSISGTGTFIVEKALAGNTSSWTNTSGRFWYMGVPMINVARSNYGAPDVNANRLWSYAESTKSYTELNTGTALLSAGTGYVHRRTANDTLTFSATGADGLYRSDLNLTGLTKTTGHSAGYHLISNPYMAYVDWHAVYTGATNMESTYYIRSNNSTNTNISALISYNQSTALSTNNSSVTATHAQLRYIAPLQSVWVRVAGAAGSTGSLSMTRGMLSHQTGNVGLKSSTVFPNLARVNLVDGNNFDQLLVYLNSDMSNEVDEYDSEKMPVGGTVQVYTMSSNKKLVMNGLKNNKKKVSVPLYLELPQTKSYTLQLSEYQVEDGLILIEDKQEGTIQDFTLMENYSFYANSGLLQNRFVLHFILPNAELATQGPSNNWLAAEEGSYTEGGDVEISNDAKGNIEITLNQAAEQKVEGTVFVTDMNGKEVYNGQLEGITTAIELDVPSGIYYLTVQSGTLIEKKKVFIQE
jgi:autotransporter-associated beta strand protein